MSTTIAVIGGVGLFLLGMSVMTGGLKAMAGPSLRTVLGKAAATPLSGVFWGAFVTLLVQSSSATTMTTIGLVSAGLLNFPQGLGLVFGANIGTTGTGWLVALIGVRVSLTAFALPLIFIGALVKLLGRGRLSAAGAALAGFALVLFGLTTLQQGMGGLAEQLHPADLPAVTAAAGAGWWSGMLGVLILVVVGLVMTALMQSSTAAIAVTLSAFHAGAVGLDQSCALIIGQNIGTATSSALAAIGASSTAKRLAVAYILFKLIAAVIALVLFPVITPMLVRASNTIDGVALLAAYHTAYNVVGVLVLLPILEKFTKFVERILPERGSPLTRCLDRAALTIPIAAIEAARRTVARALEATCNSIIAGLQAANGSGAAPSANPIAEAASALSQTQEFITDVSGPPQTEADHQRLTSTLHALDHASRLTEVADTANGTLSGKSSPEDARAVQTCVDAMRNAALIAAQISSQAGVHEATNPISSIHHGTISDGALVQLEQAARELKDVQSAYRTATLSAVGSGALSADEAIVRVDAARRLEVLGHHAWRCAVHLIGDQAQLVPTVEGLSRAKDPVAAEAK